MDSCLYGEEIENVSNLEVDVDEEVLNVHFQILNPKEVENIKSKVKGHYLKIWVANIKIIHSIIYRRFK